MRFSAVVGQGRKSASAPEFGAANDDWGRGRLGYKQVSRVRVAHLRKKKRKDNRIQWIRDHKRGDLKSGTFTCRSLQADLVVLVDGGEFPQGASQTHPAVLGLQVQQLPFLLPLPFISVGLVGEAVELLVTLCKAKSKDGRCVKCSLIAQTFLKHPSCQLQIKHLKLGRNHEDSLQRLHFDLLLFSKIFFFKEHLSVQEFAAGYFLGCS